MIEAITRAHLRDDVLQRLVYPDRQRTHYWTDDWSPEFYVALARAGFIAIAHAHRTLGPVLLPEIQRAYAVLDWPQLHVSRHVRRLRRSGRLERERVELGVGADPDAVLEGIAKHHGRRSWVIPRYREVVRALASGGVRGEGGRGAFEMRATELRAGEDGEVVAGELGYTIGATYTSLTGFCSPDTRRWNHFGTLQLVLLAERLRDAGYAFWNLGHPYMAYKRALGARVVQRAPFLHRWRASCDDAPAHDLAGTAPASTGAADDER